MPCSEKKPANTGKKNEMIFAKPQIAPSFPGGEVAWRKYLQRNLNASVPIDNNAAVGDYTVVVK